MADELQRVVDALADRLGRSVVVDDPAVRLIYASRHYGDEDPQRIRSILQREVGAAAVHHVLAQGVQRWTRPGWIPACDDIGMSSRLCVPIRRQGILLGLVLVIDADGSITNEQIRDIEDTVERMAAQLYLDHLASDEQRVSREQALTKLLSTDAAARDSGLSYLKQDEWVPGNAVPVTVTAVEVTADPGQPVQVEVAIRAAMDRAIRRRPTRAAAVVQSTRASLLDLWDTPPPAAVLRKNTRTLATDIRCLLGTSARCIVGTGAAVDGLGEAWRSQEQAVLVSRAVSLLPHLGDDALWEDLGTYGLLLQLQPHALTSASLPPPVRALITKDPSGRLLQTLTCYLDNAGSTRRTAAALHIHRTSLYYRLDRIREITGLDLDDGNDRLTLHLGLRMADLVSR